MDPRIKSAGDADWLVLRVKPGDDPPAQKQNARGDGTLRACFCCPELRQISLFTTRRYL